MKTNHSPHWDDIVELLDEYFPKGKCKERGAALMLIVYIDLVIQGHKLEDLKR